MATVIPPVTQNATSSKGPTAMVFMNMGGPATTDEVGDFLSKLFADGDLIPLGRLQPYLGPLISKRRTPKIQKQYAAIGGGSPIRKWSEYQSIEMCKTLDRISPETAPHKPYVAFRYANPLTEDMYARLLEDGFGNGRGGRAVAFTQYPQYSCSTTGSSLNELWKWRTRLEGKDTKEDGKITWSVIDRWPVHHGLVEAFAQNVEKQLATYPEEKRKNVVLLFSAHSLPMSVVNRGDTYPAEVSATVYAVMQRLGFSNPYRLCWQSQVGPSAWLGAQTSDTVQEYVKKGQTDLILIPIAFTSDHIETLFELDQEVIHEAGHPGVKRAESLNGNPVFIEALADVALTHLRSGESCSRQMGLRCQGCKSERCLEQKKFFAQAAFAQASQEQKGEHADSSNPALSFPCLDAQEARTATLSARSLSSGPEPSYTTGQHLNWQSEEPLLLDWGGLLPQFNIAHETWGELNRAKNNAILLHTGLSASSHAHSTEVNTKPGWWEKFIGPGAPLDTDKYFIICTNPIGGCYGSTGPSSIDPADGRRYATRFPILTLEDMVRAQFRLLDSFGISRLYASVGASMGGMQSLAAGVLFPERVGRVASISGCARSHPYSIAMRHTQRQVLMMDPNWSRGYYYNGIPPHAGMKLAREIATVTYRSGPEWEQRFGRRRADPSRPPALCPDFLIETYLDHAGEKFCLEYDANSLLYVSKAMDLFDLGKAHQHRMALLRQRSQSKISSGTSSTLRDSCNLTLPDKPYEERASNTSEQTFEETATTTNRPPEDLVAGLAPLRDHPTLVMGVASDILFPAWQQREIAETLRAAGNRLVTHVELGEDTSLFGHDTFLLDLKHIGGNLGDFLG